MRPVTHVLDRYYRYIRPFKFLYAPLKDRRARLQASVRAEEWRKKGFSGAKLDVCGGRNPIRPGEFLNVDIVSFPGVDLTFDICKGFPIPDGVIAEIFSAATLEHLRKHHVDHVLSEFWRILRPGGTLTICMPDMEKIARQIVDHGDSDAIQQNLFGKFKSDETDLYDTHKWMCSEREMHAMLAALGFVDRQSVEVDPLLHDPLYTMMVISVKPYR